MNCVTRNYSLIAMPTYHRLSDSGKSDSTYDGDGGSSQKNRPLHPVRDGAPMP